MMRMVRWWVLILVVGTTLVPLPASAAAPSVTAGQPDALIQTGGAPAAENSADFFISYNRANRDWAEWIAWQLEENGYTTVIQAWDMRPGSNFAVEMHRAATADRTIAVLSPEYLASEFTLPEWAAAFTLDPTSERRRLVPVRVQPVQPTGLLKQIVYIDLVGLDEPAARAALLDGVRAGRGKPSAPPPFPPATQLQRAARQRRVPCPGRSRQRARP